ncbi:putative membrane protein [Emiliania huxleyi virus 99B1]|nr:hypothetical protein EhVM1_000038 [Emiliania huxleyi virus M1]CAZ69378.1 putative membrane protein [Emiliania huxleyi virus 99B1]
MKFHWPTALLTAGVFLTFVVLFAIGVYLYSSGQVVRKERPGVMYGALEIGASSDDEEPPAAKRRRRAFDGNVQPTTKYRNTTDNVDALISSLASTSTVQKDNPDEPLKIGKIVQLKQGSDLLNEGDSVIIKSIQYKSDRPGIDDIVTIVPPRTIRDKLPEMHIYRDLFIPRNEANVLYTQKWDADIARMNADQYMDT